VRRIHYVTVARSDYGISRPVMRCLNDDPEIDLQVIVSGMHLEPRFGSTVAEIEDDGFSIAARLETLTDGDAPEDMAASLAAGVQKFACQFAADRPDILVLLGDRFDMYAAALAALPFAVPVAHIHGGELTFGAVDDALRHSMTKLSHVHFAATEDYARRIRQLGEEDWRVVVSGAPGLDNLKSFRTLPPSELESRTGLPMEPAPLVVTFHPTTLQHEETEAHVTNLLTALKRSGRPAVFTLPNADTGNALIGRAIEAYCAAEPGAVRVDNLGTDGYFNLMGQAAAMVGNSSSGLIEAPSFGLPVVNVGIRQDGRTRAANVIDTGTDTAEIEAAIQRALSPAFRDGLKDMKNPYGDGNASNVIARHLKTMPLTEELVIKRFVDRPAQ